MLAPGLGSVSGVVHLAVRRPYITALAVAALATVAFVNTVTRSSPALFRPPVPAAPVVQHTPRPPADRHKADSVHAFDHGRNAGSRPTVNGQVTVSNLKPVKVTNKQWMR